MKRSNGTNDESFEIEPPHEWFQWEFLRRNEEYQRDYARFDKQFGAWFRENGYWWAKTGPIYSREALFFLYSVIGPVAKEICRRWGISDPFDPSWTFDLGGMRLEQGSWVGLPVFGAETLGIWSLEEPDPALFPTEDDRINEMLKDVPDVIAGEPWKITNDRRLIRLEIDITMPMELVLHEVKREVDFAKRRYEAQVEPLPDHRRKPRTRMDQYETYLQIWQLRKEKGWTFEQIARSVFPNEMKCADQFSPVIKRVRIQYNRACKLIEGDYRQIEG